MLLKCCTQYVSTFGKLSSDHGTEKGQFSFQTQRKTMPKNVQTTTQLHSFHMLAKQCSKFSNLSFNSTWTENFHIFKLDLEKAEEPETNCQHLLDHRKSKRIQKGIYFCFIDCAKPFAWHIIIIKMWEYQTTLTAFWEICMHIKKQQLELAWNNGLVPNSERSRSRLYIVTLLI